MTAPTVDTPGEDQKFNRLLNAFGKAYHDYIRSDSTSLRFAGDAMDAARDAVEDYVGSQLLAARREVEDATHRLGRAEKGLVSAGKTILALRAALDSVRAEVSNGNHTASARFGIVTKIVDRARAATPEEKND